MFGLTRETKITISGETSKYERSLRNVKRSTKRMTQNVQRSWKSAAGKITGYLAVIGIGYGVKELAGSFLDAANTSEQFRVRLQALLGSTEEGARLFKDMTEYASKVPFEFEQIMSSATQLSGVMKGGVNEINTWMPLIGDLAAVSGLSIEKTTEQVVRMYSAGAGAADLFRERGITAMMGFEAGVSYSAEETRKKMMDEWQKADSQFAGVTEKLAGTWTGLMSMLKDKWFAFRTMLMDAGVFNELKKVLSDINTYAENWLKANKELIKIKIPEYIDDITEAIEDLKGPLAFVSKHWKMLMGAAMGAKFGGAVGAVLGAGAGAWIEVYGEMVDVMDKHHAKTIEQTKQRIANLEKQKKYARATAILDGHYIKQLDQINTKLIAEKLLLADLQTQRSRANAPTLPPVTVTSERGGSGGTNLMEDWLDTESTDLQDSELALALDLAPVLKWPDDWESGVSEQLDKWQDLYNQADTKREDDRQAMMERMRLMAGEAFQADIEAYQFAEDEKLRIAQESANKRLDMESWLREEMSILYHKGTSDFINNLKTTFMAFSKDSKTMFTLYKAVAIAQAVVEGAKSAVSAYSAGWQAGGPYAGPALSAAYLAASIAATGAQIMTIARTEIGSSGQLSPGGVPATPTYPVSPDTGLPTGNNTGSSFTVYIEGDFIGDEAYIEKLAEKINEGVEDRDVRLVASHSQYAEAMA